MKTNIKSSLLLGCFTLLLSASCSTTPKQYTAEIFAMNTLVSISLWGDQGQEAIGQAQDFLYALDDSFSTTRSHSQLSQLNQSTGTWQKISEDMEEVLYFAREMSIDTQGAFDPTVCPIVKAWGFTESEHRVPSEEELEDLLPLVDATLLEIDFKEHQLFMPEDMMLDLGGIVKGYASDRLVELFHSLEVDSASIDLGGNVYVLGSKIDGSSWTVGIQNPYGGGYVGSLPLEDKAIITSGGYQRYFKDPETGTTYSHIIDPRTGYPADSGLASVTIISNSGMRGDVLSTAFFVMGFEESVEYWKRYENFDMVLICEEGDVYITPNLSSQFTLVKGYSQGELKVIS